MRLLETSGLTKRFGGLTVMNDLDFFIEEGEIKGFLGPNGAGKSTFFNLITGVHTPTSGHIIYGGKDITKAKPHQVAKMGIGRTFQLIPCSATSRCLKMSPPPITCGLIPPSARCFSTPRPIRRMKSTSPSPPTKFWSFWA